MRTTKIALRAKSPGCRIMGCYHVAMKDEVRSTEPVYCLFHQRYLRIARGRVEVT